jgi:hypothetical protein
MFCWGTQSPGSTVCTTPTNIPPKILAIVGIDASVPGQINGLSGQGKPLKRLLATSGLLRIALSLVPSLAEPDGDVFTPQERKQIRLMTNWNWANSALLDEANQGARNFALVQYMRYPHDLPVLQFVKKSGSQPRWKELHEQQLANLAHGELVELDGGHYLHWTKSRDIAERIRKFPLREHPET